MCLPKCPQQGTMGKMPQFFVYWCSAFGRCILPAGLSRRVQVPAYFLLSESSVLMWLIVLIRAHFFFLNNRDPLLLAQIEGFFLF